MKWTPPLLLAACVLQTWADVLSPGQVTISHQKPIKATSTCGEINGQPIREMFCSIAGSTQYSPYSSYSYQENTETSPNPFHELRNPREAFSLGGHGCGTCDASSPTDRHPADYMVDGRENWWQSPPLSRGMQYNQVNITIDLEQEFHVAYVWIQMANSPKPSTWILERSTDYGKTFQPWFYFAENHAECMRRFGVETLSPITEDSSVICRTDFSNIQPLDNAEIVINLLENRPSRLSFATSEELQNFTRATNVRIRLLGTRTLQGHLMDLNEMSDPSVTRRYFYAIKEILMGGRCVCNGHASTCDILDHKRPRALLCRCEHNTCGDMCDQCCSGFEQKKWQPTTAHNNFTCEPCNCFGRSNECVYEEELATNKKSLDIHGNYEGGGRCLNCRDHTTGINCNECEVGFFRPEGVNWNDTRPCKQCQCDPSKHTGACDEGTGRCECQPRFEGENCDRCAKGYYDPPECKKCECMVDGTVGEECLPTDGQCPCKAGYGGVFCETCSAGFTNVTAGCVGCECSDVGAEHKNCSAETGQCVCKSAYSGLACDQCQLGYFGFPNCTYCNCDPIGTEGGRCDAETGQCLCKHGFVGEKCDKCDLGFYGYPNCRPCDCDGAGAKSPECDAVSGQCPCFANFTSRVCDKCAAGFYDYPNCKACSCLIEGAKGQTCDNNGQCYCKNNFEGERCDRCRTNFYNFPACEECNCNPSGVTQDFAGCDKVAPGELCSCREHVTGRICDQCKPTFWDLQYHHPGGCISCNCSLAGTISQTNSCNQRDGKCECKRNAGGRRCDECANGFFNLQSHNQQGCEPCNCDVGGSIRSECNGQTGQCRCRPRITGLRCDKPIDNHYYPTLWHNQYEAEDGHTEDNRPVRFAVDAQQFPNFSWRGYAVFSPIQEKIILDIDIAKSSVYRLLFKFHNPTSVPIQAVVAVVPRTSSVHDQEQLEKVTFPPTSEPAMKEITVNGKPFVMNPGRWALTVSTKQRLFLDFVVILPSEYYEANSLRIKGTPTCKAHTLNVSICVDLLYPPVTRIEAARIDAANEGSFKNVHADGTTSDLDLVPVEILPELVGKAVYIRTDKDPKVIEAEFTVPEDNEYALVLEYHHLAEKNFPINVEVLQEGESLLNGTAVIHHCPYATFCRELVTTSGVIPFVPLKAGKGSVQIRVEPMHEFGLAAVSLIRKADWSSSYLNQVPNCVRKNGKCLAQEYPSAASAIVAEAEAGPGQAHAINADKLPFEVTNTGNIHVVPLDAEKGTLDIPGVVPTRGHYKFLVHYYNPDNAPIDMSVLLQYHDQFSQAVVPLAYCPSVSGCRALIRDKEKPDVQQFFIEDKYIATFYFNETQQGPVYIDSVTAVPYNSFNENLMSPLPVDLSADFIDQCAENHYKNHPTNASNFCKEKIFSLTTDFNSAAFSCDCNARGSESFACEEYGGQCKCKPNVIGRRCERCAPGYYNFPECIKCKCGASQQCDETTGQCFCPPHVEGTSCDRCVGYAFGFDPLIGCQPCGCQSQGSEGGAQQCDPESGQCLCRESVGGRQCDRCLAGFYGFPSCYSCRCDTSGTTEAICDPTTAVCQCKENVYGSKCDTCKIGTFDLSKENPKGCADCFCFGITEQCRSSMFPVNIGAVDLSQFSTNDADGKVTLDNEEALYESGENSPASVYFNAPINHGADHTDSYGLTISFKLSVTPKGDQRKMSTEADVRLHGGNNLTAEFWAAEQPADPENTFSVKVKLVPENFLFPTGKSFTREDLMMLLQSLKNISIKASYFESPQSARLVEFGLESATERGEHSVIRASSVEQCNCPAPYTGASCQQCSAGYYRVSGGSYLGSCVPCDCNGHSGSCDPDTGVCFDCEDNTHGDHCEFCDEGHYGDATTGSPYSCMPCACPYTEAGNNFATSCQVSDYGEVLSCQCKPGYTGDRCERCASGFFGEPSRPGGSCQPCNCNDNNNLTDPRACHPITGDCYLCEQNTDGRHCEWCASWFHGDAVTAKNCTNCDCDQCGSTRCDNIVGNCECKPNVVGESCDRCAPDFWGFSRCQGCHACHCGTAASSAQCHGETGQCACRPGAAGLRCEHCEHGFWNYGEHGCTKCDCEADLSMGTVCDVRTGQCHCQEGATGSRCDQCEKSYLRIPTLGCRRCDECVHHLIYDTNALQISLDHLNKTIGNISSATLVGARISRNNKNLMEYTDLANLLTNTDSDYNNLLGDAKAGVIDRANQLDAANRSRNDAIRDTERVQNLTESANGVLQKIKDNSEYARFIVDSVRRLGLSIGSHSTALQVDPRYLEEAQQVLMDLESATTSEEPEKMKKAKEVLLKLEETLGDRNGQQGLLNDRIENVKGKGQKVADYMADAQKLLKKSKQMIEGRSKTIREQALFKIDGLHKAITDDVEKLNKERSEVSALLLEANNKTEMTRDHIEAINTLSENLDEARDNVTKDQTRRQKREGDIDKEAVKIKAEELRQEALRLNGTFGSTRLESESAVAAANAYQGLADSLSNAKETATKAIEITGNEKDGLEEMFKNLADKLADSKKINDDSTKLKGEVEGLIKEASGMERNVDQLTSQVEEMKKDRNRIQQSLKKIQKTTDDELQGKIDQVESISKDIVSAVEGDKDKLNGVKTGAEGAFKAHTDAMQSVKSSRNNIKELIALKPKLIAAFDAMKDAASNRTAKLEALTDKISQIKEMIAVARDAANRIRLGAHFERGSSLDLNMPHRVARSAAHTDISFYFRTSADHGIPLFFGNEEGSAGTRAVPTDDYIAVEIEYGKPKVTVDLGDEPLVVKLDTSVSDSQWRRIDVKRIGKSSTVTLTKPGSDEIAEKKQAVSDGNKSVLNLHQTMSKLFVGGIPANSRIASEIRNRDFVGDIEELLLHGEPVGLWNTKSQGNTRVQGSQKRPRNTDAVENQGISLNGEGYIVHELGHWNPRKRTVFSIQFLTYSPDGLLFFVGKDREFLQLELSFGAVKLSLDFGSGAGQWTTDKSDYNDGQWHTVSVIRDGTHIKLGVDGETGAEGDSPGDQNEMSVTENFYLGGVPSGINMRSPIEPLRGCLRSVRLNSDEVDLQGRGVRASKGIRNACPLGGVSTVSILSDRSSVLFNNISTKNEAEVTLRFKTREQKGLLLTVRTEEDDLLSLSFADGQILAQTGEEKLALDLASASDEQWHFVSVKKTNDFIRIDVDDLYSKKGDLKNGEENHAGEIASITFGRYDSGSFVGCVGDVTFNGELLDFSKAVVKEVSLTGCSLKDDLVKTPVASTTASPDVAAPTTKAPATMAIKTTAKYSPAEMVQTTRVPEEAEDVVPIFPTFFVYTPEPLVQRKVPTPRPEGSCALPRNPRGFFSDNDGTRFGATANTRLEYAETPDAFDKKGTFSLQIRATASSGVILLATNEKRSDHFGLFIHEGKLIFSYDAGNGQVVMKSNRSILDGEWHSVKATRNGEEAALIIDDDSIDNFSSLGIETIDTEAPLYVGGINPDLATYVKTLVPGVKSEFGGCIREIKLNEKKFDQEPVEFNTVPCQAFNESGIFFGPDGGYAILKKEYHIGQTFAADLEIRPRTDNAILLSVGKVEYLTVQLVKGSIKFVVDSGAGPEELLYTPPAHNGLCDGHWHSVKIMKKKNLMTLTVDGKSNLHIMKKNKKPDVVTNDPIYLGGVPEGVTNKGLTITENYVGCVRIVNYGDKKSRVIRRKKQLDIANMETFGDVNKEDCPVN